MWVNMNKSWINRVLILLISILVSSVLFFLVTFFTYRNILGQTILNSNNSIVEQWTHNTDSRLYSMYEHIYDLSSTLYNSVDVRKGATPMDYNQNRKIGEAITLKIISSSDITAMFILDPENDIYLYYNNGYVTTEMTYYLKLYLRINSANNTSSVSDPSWQLIEISNHGFYYKAVRLGRYVVGVVSDIELYYGHDDTIDNESGFIVNSERCFYLFGDKELEYLLDSAENDNDFVEGYAVSIDEQQYADAQIVYITKPVPAWKTWSFSFIFLILVSAGCIILAIFLYYFIVNKVSKPTQQLFEANRQLSLSNLDYRLDIASAGSSEFEDLFTSFNEMSEKIGTLTIEKYDEKLKREENYLKMLRAQMKPHTFLNGITTISNMTYTAKPETMRSYISAFAKFTRYMLHTSSDWTTIGEELEHIDNYVKMQKIRFPKSIEIIYDCPEEIKNINIPYLTLFSLVENSFKHAMTLVNTMVIKITGEFVEFDGFKGVRLVEEDNGPGFTEEILEKLEEISEQELFTKEHLGLTNVRYTLNLIYRRNDLLRLSNSDKGAHVEMLIPVMEEEDETTGM